MASVAESTTGLVEYLVKNIVDEPDAVEVSTEEGDDGVTINVKVAEGDIGHVIGREGHIIKSIRTLARACATKEDTRVEVEILD